METEGETEGQTALALLPSLTGVKLRWRSRVYKCFLFRFVSFHTLRDFLIRRLQTDLC